MRRSPGERYKPFGFKALARAPGCCNTHDRTFLSLARRRVDDALQGVIAGAHDDGSLGPRHFLAPLDHDLFVPARCDAAEKLAARTSRIQLICLIA